MNGTGRVRPLALALVLAVAVVAGCNGTDSTESTDSEQSGSGERLPFADRLELLPRSLDDLPDGASVSVTMADLDRAAELAGAQRPDDLSDEEATGAYLRALEGIGQADGPTPEVATLLPERAMPRAHTQLPEYEAEVGWSILDVTWYVDFPNPPVTLAVLGGEFDEGRITDAVGAPDDGRWLLGAEDGSFDLQEPSAARPLGEPLHMALDPAGRLLVASVADPVQESLAGPDGTLADVAVLRDLAAAMDDQDAYSALFHAGGDLRQPGDVAGDGEDPLQPFLGVASGIGHDGTAPYLVFAYAHADAGTAEANAEAVRTVVDQGRSGATGRPWSEQVTVDEIQVQDTTVVARLALADDIHPSLYYRVLYERDTLATHG